MLFASKILFLFILQTNIVLLPCFWNELAHATLCPSVCFLTKIGMKEAKIIVQSLKKMDRVDKLHQDDVLMFSFPEWHMNCRLKE